MEGLTELTIYPRRERIVENAFINVKNRSFVVTVKPDRPLRVMPFALPQPVGECRAGDAGARNQDQRGNHFL